MTNLKDKLEAKLNERRAERVLSSPSPQVARPDNDPDLEAALALVAKGELSRAYRTPNGALVTTQKSDPANSPAAPEARVGAV